MMMMILGHIILREKKKKTACDGRLRISTDGKMRFVTFLIHFLCLSSFESRQPESCLPFIRESVVMGKTSSVIFNDAVV